MATKRIGVIHHCTLMRGSDSRLPILPPQSSRTKKRLREIRKTLMVSSEHSTCKSFFRSRAAVSAERRRHVRSTCVYIIHPFSSFSRKREIVMTILWMITFFKDPFVCAYYEIGQQDSKWWVTVDVLIDALMLINIVLCLLTGVPRIKTKEVVLIPSKIVRHYVCTYFFFDLFGTIPFAHLIKMGNLREEAVYFILASCLHFLRFVRIKTMLEYLRRLTEVFRCGDATHQIICLIVMSLLCLHWCACLVFIIPRVHYGFTGQLSNKSWVVQARIQPGIGNTTVTNRYLECLLSAFCHFYRAGFGMYMTEDPGEQLMYSFIILAGLFFTVYVLVAVLQAVSSVNASENKYEELLNELDEFIRKKKLPPAMRKRLILYYENKFQKRYFEEQFIMNTLSDHLKYEIFLYSCKGLVDKVQIFQGLSKSTIGSIVACLKQEVFLPNDVITKRGTLANFIYFIAYGTVAYMLVNGKEFCHLEDGDLFGEVPVFITQLNKKVERQTIALETTEIFKLPVKDLARCIYQDDELGERFLRFAKERYSQMRALETDVVADEVSHRRDVIHELRQRHILEHTLYKRR